MTPLTLEQRRAPEIRHLADSMAMAERMALEVNPDPDNLRPPSWVQVVYNDLLNGRQVGNVIVPAPPFPGD